MNLKKISDEPFNFRPILPCSSSLTGCCDTFTTVSQYRDHNLILSFLQGLNDNYYAIRSQILLVDPLPPLTNIYSMILQQERQLNVGNNRILCDPTILAVDTRNSSAKYFPGTKPRKWLIQKDLKTLKMIGNATLCHGLYELVCHHSNTHDAFRTAPLIHVVDTFTPIFPLTHIWHYRLGHPSSTCYTNVTKANSDD
ncbi:uncharacterized protein [Cicer arietinum]|uniref:Uncharacterized protein LOC105852319 isoform X2 n=1 Tax=Cicer arietinum TaxID=3827 RepID=A0A3Q7YG15_CICAR|nr:uncharacterized protein LOC105852319 isoform X2 [Cicer arietinum]